MQYMVQQLKYYFIFLKYSFNDKELSSRYRLLFKNSFDYVMTQAFLYKENNRRGDEAQHEVTVLFLLDPHQFPSANGLFYYCKKCILGVNTMGLLFVH